MFLTPLTHLGTLKVHGYWAEASGVGRVESHLRPLFNPAIVPLLHREEGGFFHFVSETAFFMTKCIFLKA